MMAKLTAVEKLKQAFYEPLDEATKLQLEPTNICNLDCVMCPRKSFAKGLGRMSFEDFKTIMSKFTKLQSINFTGWGEPTLHQDLYKMIDYAADLGIEITFTTNGTFLDEKTVLKMVSSKVSRIAVSFDFPVGEDFEAIRRHSHFGPLMEGVLRLCKAKGNKQILFSVVLSKLNAHQFEGILKIAQQAGIEGISLEPIYDLHGHDVPSLSPEESKAFLDSLPGLEAKYGVPVNPVFYSRKHAWRNELSKARDICPYMNGGLMFVNWSGDAAPCCHHPNKMYGNLLELDAKQVWNNLKPFRDGGFKEDSFCKRCYVYRRWNLDNSAVYVKHDPAKKDVVVPRSGPIPLTVVSPANAVSAVQSEPAPETGQMLPPASAGAQNIFEKPHTTSEHVEFVNGAHQEQ